MSTSSLLLITRESNWAQTFSVYLSCPALLRSSSLWNVVYKRVVFHPSTVHKSQLCARGEFSSKYIRESSIVRNLAIEEKSVTLKWKDISIVEAIIWYSFEDENGEDFHFDDIYIKDFELDNNDYFEPDPDVESIFTQSRLKEGIESLWFTITYIEEERAVELADDETFMAKIIIGIVGRE